MTHHVGETGVRFGAMGCGGDIRLADVPEDHARQLADKAIKEVQRIERKYSRYLRDSVVSTINAAAGSGVPVEVDEETCSLLRFADSLWQLSDGLFDITSGVLRRAWDFKSASVPHASQLEALRPLIGWDKVVVDSTTADRAGSVRLMQLGMEIDFGGFGKEYAADRAAALLMAEGVQHGYVNLGGDIRLLGPRPDGTPWELGVVHPRDDEKTVASMNLCNGAVATSGDYERYMEVNGERYCHILDPSTLQPVRYWQSISVVAPVCTAAGAMSTIAMLKQDKASAFLQGQGVMWLGVDRAGQIVEYTP